MKNTNDEFIADLQVQREYIQVPPIKYIYDNISTNSYVEFTLESVKETIPSTIALDIFFDRITNPKQTLPPSLMEWLKQDDFHLLIDAAEYPHALEELERYIYIKKENETYRDAEGYVYKIIKRSKKEVILESADADETVQFIVKSDDFRLNQDSLMGAIKGEN